MARSIVVGLRPVITIPERPAEGRSVLVAYDASIPAARALQAFQSVGCDEAQPVHVLCVHAEHLEAAPRSRSAWRSVRRWSQLDRTIALRYQ